MRFILFFFFAIGILLPLSVFAENVTSIPLEVPFGITGEVSGLIEYISVIYVFIVGGIGIITAVMIMVNGLRWAAAAGNPSIISNAKDGIISALTGLLIALTSFFILNALNPALVVLQDPTPEELAFGCEGDGRIRFLDQISSEYPDLGGRLLYVGDSDAACMTTDIFEKLITAMQILEDGGTFTDKNGTTQSYGDMKIIITSAYRSVEKQEEAYQCYTDYLSSGSCACNSCNLASAPPDEGDTLTGHLAGNAIDMGWTGSSWDTNSNYLSTPWHELCMVDQSYGSTSSDGKECTEDLYDSVYAMNSLFDEAGLPHIRKEWWHYEPGGGASAGNYSK